MLKERGILLAMLVVCITRSRLPEKGGGWCMGDQSKQRVCGG